MENNNLIIDNNDSSKTNKFLGFLGKIWKPIKKVFGFILKNWFFVFFPLRLIKELIYDKLRHDQQKVFVSWIFLAPTIIGFLTFFLYPLCLSFLYAFSSVEPNGTFHFGLVFPLNPDTSYYDWNATPTWDLWNNFRYALRVDADFPVSLWNTITGTVVDIFVITIFSLLMAVMLNSKFRGRAFVRAIFFLPVIFNSEAMSAALEMVESLGSKGAGGEDALSTLFNLEEFLTGLKVPKTLVSFLSGITSTIYDTITYSGIQILIFLTAIQSVPKHLYEAATIEGATGYEQFWKITLPMVSPMILTVVVYTIVDAFLRSEINETMDYVYAMESEYGYYAAMSWLYILASLLIMGLSIGILSKVVFYYDEKK